MTEVSASAATDPAGPDPDDRPEPELRPALTAAGRRLRWWRELGYIVAFYVIYSWVRNQFGSAGTGSAEIAYQHARDIIDVQDAMRLWFEPELQRWYLDLPADGLIRGWNIYYGTAHFVVTAGALMWLYRRQPDRYSVWRTTLAAMTAAALIGFASYSLMPPRLLGDTSKYGACFEQQVVDCHGDDVVDTIAAYGGFVSFGNEKVAAVSNQYAAMPSMHTGWSTWSACVMYGLLRKRRSRILIWLYPAATVFCIMVTGNHYWLDAVGGLAAFAVGLGAATLLTRWNERRFLAREQKAAATASPTA